MTCTVAVYVGVFYMCVFMDVCMYVYVVCEYLCLCTCLYVYIVCMRYVYVVHVCMYFHDMNPRHLLWYGHSVPQFPCTEDRSTACCPVVLF